MKNKTPLLLLFNNTNVVVGGSTRRYFTMMTLFIIYSSLIPHIRIRKRHLSRKALIQLDEQLMTVRLICHYNKKIATIPPTLHIRYSDQIQYARRHIFTTEDDQHTRAFMAQ